MSNLALHESAHSLIGKALGLALSSDGIYLSQDSGQVTGHFPGEWLPKGERQWRKLLVALAGRVSEYIADNRDPIDCLDGYFSPADRRAIEEASAALGKKSKELAVGTLHVALTQNWPTLLKLSEALENRTEPVDLPMVYATSTNHGQGPIEITTRPRFDLAPRRDEVQHILDNTSMGLPSWEDTKPRNSVKQLFASQEKTKKVLRDPLTGDISEVIETGNGLDQFTEALRGISESLQTAFLAAAKPKRVRRFINRDSFGDIESISEEEIA